MKVYIVSLHMADEAGLDDTLQVFLDKDKALAYKRLLYLQTKNNWRFIEFVERDIIE